MKFLDISISRPSVQTGTYTLITMLSLLVAVCFLACGSYASKTVYFSLTLTWEPAAPDGFTRNIIKMNGQFPGPELVVDQGDDVEFLVWNNMPNETSVHFHGMDPSKPLPASG